MFGKLRIAVVVPAYDEERAIGDTVRSIPRFVDHVIVVDDCSRDRTSAEARAIARRGLEVVRHAKNRGVGAAIATGYARALELDVDCAVVMAGDGQMDPDDLPALLEPIALKRAEYVKGNRFKAPGLEAMPPARLIGNLALSLITKATSGYWHLFDSQCGYTAASRRALAVIQRFGIFPRYGYPNDLLARLNAVGLRVEDAPVRAVYGPHWKSGIKLSTVIYPMSFVLVRSWLWRLAARYVARVRVDEPPRRREAEASCASAS